MKPAKKKTTFHRTQRYFLTGIITVIPIWITWVVFEFFVKQLSEFGRPWVKALSKAIQIPAPTVAEALLQPWFESAVAVILTLIALYVLGWVASLVVGKRLISLFDWFMERIPLVQTVYGSVRKLMGALQQKPDEVQRVVLIEFPSPEMKTVGFVTRVLKDHKTGQQLAAVYVPTTPNPTSGYLEIVPLEKVVSTDWTVDEAMSFIMSGGAVAPENIQYSGDPPQAL